MKGITYLVLILLLASSVSAMKEAKMNIELDGEDTGGFLFYALDWQCAKDKEIPQAIQNCNKLNAPVTSASDGEVPITVLRFQQPIKIKLVGYRGVDAKYIESKLSPTVRAGDLLKFNIDNSEEFITGSATGDGKSGTESVITLLVALLFLFVGMVYIEPKIKS